jgi:cell division septum initiation protein DivIVA
MEIFTLLDTLEDILDRSKHVPFTEKGIVDKEEILEIIQEIRLKLPDELKQAKWIKEERGRILQEAEKEADDIVREAENRIISMIDEHEITRKAYDQKAEIIETANEMSREITKGTKDYADGILENLENAINDINISIAKALETIEQNRNELK